MSSLLLFHGWKPSAPRPAPPRAPAPAPLRLSSWFDAAPDWQPMGLVGPRPLPQRKPAAPRLPSWFDFDGAAPVVPDWVPLGLVGPGRLAPARRARPSEAPPLVPILPARARQALLVQHDSRLSPRARNHEQRSAAIFNSLLREFELLQTAVSDWDLGYVPSNASDWQPPQPQTVGEALARLAVVLKALNGGGGA